MSTLVTTRMPDGSLHRFVVRREPSKKLAALSPFLYRGGMGALGLTFDPFAAAGGGVGVAAGATNPLGLAIGAASLLAKPIENLFSGPARPARVINQAKSQTNSATQAYQQWRQVKGTVPGRNIGLSNMQLVWQGSVQAGNWAGAQGHPEYTIDAINGCPACGGNTIADQVPLAVKAGITDPQTIMNQYFIPAVRRTAKNPWAIPSGAENQQLVMDVIDAKVAQLNPSAPIPSIYPQAPPTPATAPVTAQAPVPSPMTAVVPTSVPQTALAAPVTPSAQVLATAMPAPQADQTAALIQQMMSQGASQQAAFTAAIQSLQASGTPITPQVQQAVAATTAGAGGALPSWMSWVGIGAGVLILGFMLAKPKGSPAK